MVRASVFMMGMISAFYLGWKADDVYSFFVHEDHCPVPASTRALQGCEAVMETMQFDLHQAEYEVYRCEAKTESLENTIDCMLNATNCRSRDPNELH